MQKSDWTSRWNAGQIGFHQPDVNSFLGKYAEQVWGPDALGRVYVPLCGKSLDMVFLAKNVGEVVGVEFVEQAVKEFFAEQGLTPDRSTPYSIVHRLWRWKVTLGLGTRTICARFSSRARRRY